MKSKLLIGPAEFHRWENSNLKALKDKKISNDVAHKLLLENSEYTLWSLNLLPSQ